MIINATNTITNKSEYTRFNNLNKPQKSNTTAIKQSSPNFKGGALMGFASYLTADIVGIIIGVGATDSFFKNKNLQQAKEFGLKVIKRNHKEDLSKIESLTREVFLGLEAFEKNKTTKKLAQKIKSTYEKSFNTELFIDKKLPKREKNLNTIAINMGSLQNTVDELFVKMNDQDRFTSIAKPFLNTLSKAQEKF